MTTENGMEKEIIISRSKVTNNAIVGKSVDFISDIMPLLEYRDIMALDFFIAHFNTKPGENKYRCFEAHIDDFLRVFPKVGRTNVYKVIRDAVIRINSRPIRKKVGNKIIDYFWFEKIVFEKGKFRIHLLDVAAETMLDLKRDFINYRIGDTANFKNKFCGKLYCILKTKQWVSEKYHTPFLVKYMELRELIGVPSKQYKNWEPFRRRVVMPCINEINVNTDIYVILKTEKIGLKIDKLAFYLEKKTDRVVGKSVRVAKTEATKLFELLLKQGNFGLKRADSIVDTAKEKGCINQLLKNWPKIWNRWQKIEAGKTHTEKGEQQKILNFLLKAFFEKPEQEFLFDPVSNCDPDFTFTQIEQVQVWANNPQHEYHDGAIAWLKANDIKVELITRTNKSPNLQNYINTKEGREQHQRQQDLLRNIASRISS